MINTPIYGFSYPVAADHTRTWEYWQSLATQLEAKLSAGLACFRLDLATKALTGVGQDADGTLALNIGGFGKAGAVITVPQAGLYEFTFLSAFSAPTANAVGLGDIFVNNANAAEGVSNMISGFSGTAFCSTIMQCAAGTTVKAVVVATASINLKAAPASMLMGKLLQIRP